MTLDGQTRRAYFEQPLPFRSPGAANAHRHRRNPRIGRRLCRLRPWRRIDDRRGGGCSERDERGHEGAGPGLERLGYALSKDRVQCGAEHPGACIGMRFLHDRISSPTVRPLNTSSAFLARSRSAFRSAGVRGVMRSWRAYSYY